MNQNLFAKLHQNFPVDQNRTFISYLDGTRLSYGDLLRATGRMANALTDLGVGQGDRIAVQTEKSVETILLFLASQRLGAVYVPFNTAYTANELRYLLGDAAPRLFVCSPQNAAQLRDLATEMQVAHLETLGTDGRGSLMDKSDSAGADFDDVISQSDDLAAILYTSGTTGRSKGAMLTHGNLASNALTLRELWQFTAADRLLHALPIFHTHGLFVATNVVLMAGASMVFLPSFNVDQVVRALSESTVMMGVPTFYTRLLQHPEFDRARVKHIRLFISGSAPLAASMHQEFLQRTGHEILERYGMTETNMNTSNPYQGRRIPGSVGKALPDVDVRVVDVETRRPLSAKEVGVIEIRGPNVFKGYWRQPEKTALELREDGFFVSGDLGYIDADGYVYIVGRHKDLIITGGLNVYPAEVEAAVEEVPEVAQAAVIGVPHHDFGEAVVAVVTLRADESATEQQILSHLAERLAKFKCPKRIIFVDRLPINVMGKVQKNVLRESMCNLFTK